MSLGFVVLFHIVVIYAFASGLAQQMAQKLPESLKAEVVPQTTPEVKPPPPPPPELMKPPPPYVPPPEITIQSEAPPTNTITVTHTVTPPAPKEQAITAPASVGAPHTCPEDRWYPPLAICLNQEGTTTLAFHIMPDGSISNVTVAELSGHDLLDEAAVRCASSAWHYKPAMRNGQPIEWPWKASVRWQLR